MMKNMTKNPARSLAHAARVDDSCVMVLLKLMYLKTLIQAKKTLKASPALKTTCQKLMKSKEGKASGS